MKKTHTILQCTTKSLSIPRLSADVTRLVTEFLPELKACSRCGRGPRTFKENRKKCSLCDREVCRKCSRKCALGDILERFNARLVFRTL